MTNLHLESGSFRDRNGRVFYSSGHVFRVLSEKALKEWETLSSTKFFRRSMAAGKIVLTDRIDPDGMIDSAIIGNWAAVLKHKRIPFISYPYEWSYGMLKDAALLQLDLLQSALDEDMILKDSSAFNFQWEGTRPVFIDIPSFERLTEGEPWVGYRQFCQLFLYPLFLQAYKDIPFQPWLRGNIDGIEVEHCKNLMSLRDLIRPGIFMHVFMQAKLQARYSKTQRDVKGYLRTVGFNKDLIKNNVNRLKKLICSLKWRRSTSQWANYAIDHSYSDKDEERKKAFVHDIAMLRTWSLVWDMGCNIGTFSRIVAKNANYVVAMDSDHLTIENLYQSLKTEGHTSILPLVINVADTSPNLGWRGLERMALTDRTKPELTLCLALVHHIVISANIPLKEFIEWLASLGTNLVIEFVNREDPMVKTLLRNKDDHYTDYEIGYFERCLSGSFDVVRREVLSSGTRILYYGEAKPNS